MHVIVIIALLIILVMLVNSIWPAGRSLHYNRRRTDAEIDRALGIPTPWTLGDKVALAGWVAGASALIAYWIVTLP